MMNRLIRCWMSALKAKVSALARASTQPNPTCGHLSIPPNLRNITNSRGRPRWPENGWGLSASA
eukprot:8594875-Heterocapsa_arctica.AAC.1